VDTGNGLEVLQKVTGIGPVNFHFSDTLGRDIEIPNFKEKLIPLQSKPVDYDAPLFGLLLFIGDAKFYKVDTKGYELECTDVFGHTHKIKANPKEVQNVSWLADRFDLKFSAPASDS
jgi:hypothetical protein